MSAAVQSLKHQALLAVALLATISAASGCGDQPVAVPAAQAAAPPPLLPIGESVAAAEPLPVDSPAAAQKPDQGENSTEPPAAPPVEPVVEAQAAAGSTDVGTENSEGGSGTTAAAEAAATDPDGTPGGPAQPLKQANPFPQRVAIPELPQDQSWFNSRPLKKADLKGKFVLLDFWTYCCINCMHVLPELKKLEKEFASNLVVIGVHSAKFETEKQDGNIRAAILRYEIEHPVVNDADHAMWRAYGVSSWPTIVLIDPEGMYVGRSAGEFKAEDVSAVLNRVIPFYREQRLLDENPLKLALEAEREEPTPLRYPGKILADEMGRRLFISDSNHNRIVVATLDGKLLDVIGSGAIGQGDGDYQSASFNHPQGCALAGETLYVADTENHLLRKVDLRLKQVTTIAGTGEQGGGWPGIEATNGRRDRIPDRWVGAPSATALNSPWALWVHKSDLYIAMAGPHQIWKMPLDEREIGPYAGNGREDIVDGPLLPKVPFLEGFASFAQPSGLSSDGTMLYVADSEGSSIRAVPFDPKRHVRTVVGSAHHAHGRLFEFGDKDGPRLTARLQHCLEVVYLNNQLYVADTYNHKIKVISARNGETRTLAGTGKPGTSDAPPQFHEPAGLTHAKGKLYIADTNNHLVRTLELSSGKVATLSIDGLTPPAGP